MSSIRQVDKRNLQFRHPFNAFITGPSQCGKTSLLRKILEFHKETIDGIDTDVIKVAWSYGAWQKSYENPIKNCNVKYIMDLPNEDDIEGCQIVVIDDLMHKLDKSPFVQTLFTAGTHHNNQSVFVLTQNYYQKGDIPNTLRKNAHYLILFKDPSDTSQVRTLSWRMFIENPKYLLSAYKQATKLPHGYLLIDRTQETEDSLRLRTHIVPTEENGFKLKQTGYILI